MKISEMIFSAASGRATTVAWLLWLGIVAIVAMMFCVRYLGDGIDHHIVGNCLGGALFVLVSCLIWVREGARNR